jgi:DNA repair protein RecN (Recombination protein N)
VASGGELSRIGLALQVLASAAQTVDTLIFDEVDSGISGAVAEVVGRKLRGLGERYQVLCVTHLPQVAAQAHRQLQVSKRQDERAARTEITPLDAEGRVEAIARMLGGVRITERSRAHAREMLETAPAAG